jgi:outer membrane protein assembly factor BamA
MHSSSFEYAAEALGSDVRFVKFTLQQFFYRPLSGRVVSASAVRIGVGRGFGQDLIPSERFFAGGGNTVRGYRDNALGPTDFFGDPRGGHSFLVLNQEARFPVFRWIGGAGFVDAGNVFEPASDLSVAGLKLGVGGGVRLTTPFGLFRFDVGVPLSRGQTDRAPRFYFSLGQIF